MTEEMFRELKARGLRITKIRKAVFDILEEETKPFSTEVLTEKLNKKGLRPNKTTVYREIETLLHEGFVREVKLGLSCRVYEAASLGHHHHLVCIKCDNVEDISVENDMIHYEKEITKKTAFKVVDHSFEFFGLCGGCQ